MPVAVAGICRMTGSQNADSGSERNLPISVDGFPEPTRQLIKESRRLSTESQLVPLAEYCVCAELLPEEMVSVSHPPREIVIAQLARIPKNLL